WARPASSGYSAPASTATAPGSAPGRRDQPAPEPGPGTRQGARSRRRRGVGGGIVAVLMIMWLLVGLLLGLLGGQYRPGVPSSAPEPDSPPPATDTAGVALTEASVADIADQVLPSTVFIQVRAGGEGFTGSGFVFNQEG